MIYHEAADRRKTLRCSSGAIPNSFIDTKLASMYDNSCLKTLMAPDGETFEGTTVAVPHLYQQKFLSMLRERSAKTALLSYCYVW